MSYPTIANSQITDSVTQSNMEVLAVAPAQAMAALYQSMANSAAIAAQNAVTNQQNSNEISKAVVTQAVARIMA